MAAWVPGCEGVAVVPYEEQLRQAKMEAARRSRLESVPQVKFRQNDSGVIVSSIQRRNAGWLMTGDSPTNASPPDVPTRTIIAVRHRQPLHNKEPRYFVKAPGMVQIVSIEHYADYGTKWADKGADLERWRSLISSAGPVVPPGREVRDVMGMAGIPWFNASQCFYGKLRRKRFPWGDAVLYLTSYIQGRTGGHVNNDMLVLVVQGLTKDGRYAVNARFEIRHPGLPDSLWDESPKDRMLLPLEGGEGAVERWLDTQPDYSFSPGIGQYESFLSAMEISSRASGSMK